MSDAPPVGDDPAVHEVPLVGGDVHVGENVVARAGDTVRRAVGPHTSLVHGLLHVEAVGFDGRQARSGSMSGAARSPAATTSTRPMSSSGAVLPSRSWTGTSRPPLRARTTSPRRRTPGCLCGRTPKARKRGLDGLPRGERLLLLCDEYGLDAAARLSLLDVVAHRNVLGDETHRVRGCLQRLPGRREMCDAGSADEILARGAWFQEHRADLRRSLA